MPITQSVYEVYANATGRGLAEEGEEVEEDEDIASLFDGTKKSRLREAYEGIKQGKKREPLASSSGEVAVKPKCKMSPFKETTLYHVVTHISQASRIGLSVIVVDCVSLISRMMGYNPWNIMESASRIFSKFVYTGWIMYRLQILKRYFLKKAFGTLTRMNLCTCCVV